MSHPRKKWVIPCAILGIIPLLPPHASATDIHFDYTSFDNPNSPGANPHFGQSQFNVLNYPSIDGDYMMTSTDAHRPEMTANNNALAEFYNNFLADYNTQINGTGLNASAEADAINAYTIKHSTSNGSKPSWLILNEISASVWPDTTQKGADYRAWVIAAVTRLNTTYGYDVVTYSPFANPSTLASDWQALAAQSYIGVEDYLSGAGIMSHGTDYASRVAWAEAQYVWPKTAFGNVGVNASRLFLGEDYANTPAGTPYGRSGLSAADWDTAIQIRQDAIDQAGYTGFLAYGWGSNSMGITEAEQIEHEYYYRSRLVLPSQQPQWLSDPQINLNGTLEPLSWNYALNWLGGIPNAPGAVANFYRTNTAARTITLDAPLTVGTLTFNSPSSYTLSPGAGGTLTFNNNSALSSLLVTTGAHTISSPIQIAAAGVNISIASAATLTITGAISGSSPLIKSDLGTLLLTNSNTFTAGATVNAGTLIVSHDHALGAGGLTIATDATVSLSPSLSKAVQLTSLTLNGTAQLDLNNNSLILTYTGSSPINTIRNSLATAFNNAWTGPGINSSAAANNSSRTTAIAYAQASTLPFTTFGGQTIPTNSLLLKYTYYGDANLDGVVNSDDYALLDRSFAKGLISPHWTDGDFNYDGIVNSADYLLIDRVFAQQGAPLTPDFLAQRSAQFGPQYVQQLLTSIPEPAATALLTFPIAALLRRRRQNKLPVN